MKKLIVTVVAVILAGIASYYLHSYFTTESDKGQVIIGIGNISLETTFVVFVIFLLLAFIVAYLLTRALFLLLKSPKIIQQKNLEKKQALSQDALVSGLIDSAEGNWGKAEITLIKHAANSATPLIHYLTAAKTAHSRGAADKRDEYLRKAYDSTPDSDITVGITKAELHLSAEEYEQALDTLRRLDQISPGHAIVQRLLHKTYEKLNDWGAVHKLLPVLQKNKAEMDLDLQEIEVKTYRELLKQSILNTDPEPLKVLWDSIPTRIKRLPHVCEVYFAGVIQANGGQEIEKDLYKTLSKTWNNTLLVLWGALESSDPEKQLKQTEKFLKKHASDALLQRILGKLCLRLNNFDQAIEYLKQSVEIEPSVTAYQLLGDILSKQESQWETAIQFYRKGLLLASDEVVRETQDDLDSTDTEQTVSNGETNSPEEESAA